MDDFSGLFSPFTVPIVAIVCWFVYVIVQTLARARVRELEVRERIAMIERGLVPPPERDPQGFDQAMHTYDSYRERYEDDRWRRRRRSPSRYRSAGITMLGVGFGFMVLLTFTAGEPGVGLGVGGFMVVLGLAFLLNSLFVPPPPYYPPPPPPPAPSRSSFTNPPSA